ncbi:MAG: hypothetical protein QM330_09110 [Acidobacteriota bacterium]|nr:hypothetical protein [Acidobacteriota bacterium]NLT33923.1 hypothetical protein [Acidobacteriota bacterium]
MIWVPPPNLCEIDELPGPVDGGGVCMKLADGLLHPVLPKKGGRGRGKGKRR